MNASPDAHAARILRCVHHFDVLQLPRELVAVALVRRRYKTLAVLVHPDKNKAAGAEEAFKRLSEAYECLSDEIAQRNYIRSLAGRREAKRSAPPPPPQTTATGDKPPAYPPRKRRRKKESGASTPPPPGTPGPPPPPPPPRRQRTPEEIWRAFQEEEERLARREFLAKGFERTFASSPSGSRDDETSARSHSDETHRSESPVVDDVGSAAALESIMSSGLDEKAQSWTRWQKRRGPAAPSSASECDRDTTGGVSREAPASRPADPICCLLCRRKFPTHDALGRHESLSELHAENLRRHQSSA